MIGALVQPLYYGLIRLISNLGTDVLAALSMLIPAALGILPGFLFGTIVDALSGIIPGFTLGSLIDAITGAVIGSPIGALITAIGGAILGGIIGGLINPGKWIGALLGSIPGAVSGGAIGNVLGRILGVIALPGKWLFGCIGSKLGNLIQPAQALVPALAGACDCGCNMNDCSYTKANCCDDNKQANTEISNPGTSIAALRQQALMTKTGSTSVPETGDKGVMACGTVALLSWLALMWLIGAKKKEEI